MCEFSAFPSVCETHFTSSFVSASSRIRKQDESKFEYQKSFSGLATIKACHTSFPAVIGYPVPIQKEEYLIGG